MWIKKCPDANDYSLMLQRFVDTGEVEGIVGDKMSDYLVKVMETPTIKLQALRNDVLGRVFYDCMMRFVTLNINRSKMAYQRVLSEIDASTQATDWTSDRKKDGWKALVDLIKQRNPLSFNADFYIKKFEENKENLDSQLWNQMILDWQENINRKVEKASHDKLEEDMQNALSITEKNLNGIPEYMERTEIDSEEFLQGWNLMEGLWNEHIFDDVMKTVKMQRKYPVIHQVTELMGRRADERGGERMKVGYGGERPLNHGHKSDIVGVTSGNSISDAFPGELAMMGDDDMDGLFLRKFVTSNLQVFDSRSQMLSPLNKIRYAKARRKGPMIVCLDTSGSMVGNPLKVAKSLLLRLLMIAEKEHRECYLIMFSVSIVVFDLVKERIKVMDYLSHYTSGGTNSTKMMEETFRILNGGTEYCYGDILWISDFRIPKPNDDLLKEQLEHMRAGTCFYGLQIGVADHNWTPYFTEIYNEGWLPATPRKLGK